MAVLFSKSFAMAAVPRWRHLCWTTTCRLETFLELAVRESVQDGIDGAVRITERREHLEYSHLPLIDVANKTRHQVDLQKQNDKVGYDNLCNMTGHQVDLRTQNNEHDNHGACNV